MSCMPPVLEAPAVLHVAQPTIGGVARYLVDVVAHQLALGWRIGVVCPPEGELGSRIADAGAALFPWHATRQPGRSIVAEAVRLRRIVAGFRPDVVHLHSAKAGLAGRLAVRGTMPTVFQPHGWSWLAVDGVTAAITTRWERSAMRWTDLLVCVGEGEAAQASAAGVRGPLVVVRNGVDLERFRSVTGAERLAARVAVGVGPEVDLVVCIGRLTRQKGQDVLLRSWPTVRAGHPAAELALVGPGDVVGFHAPSTVPGVRFVGPVDDVRPWLSAADLVVFPSRWEGMSLGLLEAMASGRSTIVSDIPGLADVVDDRVGATVPADDELSLAEAILARVRDPGLRDAEGRAAAEFAIAQLDQRLTLNRLADLTAALAHGSAERSI